MMIDWENVISKFEKWIDYMDEDCPQIAIDALTMLKTQRLYIDELQHAPSYVQKMQEPERKKGHWIYLQYCANEGVYCSECHTKMFDSYPMKKKQSQFCGHCGAKMEEEVDVK